MPRKTLLPVTTTTASVNKPTATQAARQMFDRLYAMPNGRFYRAIVESLEPECMEETLNHGTPCMPWENRHFEEVAETCDHLIYFVATKLYKRPVDRLTGLAFDNLLLEYGVEVLGDGIYYNDLRLRMVCPDFVPTKYGRTPIPELYVHNSGTKSPPKPATSVGLFEFSDTD